MKTTQFSGYFVIIDDAWTENGTSERRQMVKIIIFNGENVFAKCGCLVGRC